MNKKLFLAVVLVFCMMLTLCACGGDDAATKSGEPSTAPSADTAPSGNEGDTTPSEDTNASQDAVMPTAPTPGDGQVLYTVKVVDKDGNPKVGAYVQACLEACVFTVTDAQGNAYFCLAEGDYKVTLMDDGTAPAGYTAKEHHFEAGSHEMTLVYDYEAENAAA